MNQSKHVYTSSNAKLRSDDKIVDENDQELPVGTVVHCLGALFKVTDSGIRHFVGKIEDDTYFADSKYFHRLNELTFSEQPDVTTTPDAVPQKEDLSASAYRKSSLSKMIHINEIADNLTLKAENPSATSLGASSLNDSMKMPPPNEMYLLNT